MILLLFSLYGLVSQHFYLVILGGFAFIVVLRLLWKPYTPPVLLFFMIFHWLQVFSSLLYADSLGLDIQELFNTKDIHFLFTMTFVHIVIMAFVFNGFLTHKQIMTANFEMLKKAAQQVNVRNVIIGYFVSIVVLPIVMSATVGNASLYQLVLSFSIIKTLFTGLLVFVLLFTKRNRMLILAILVFDFILSFASFFSEFKTLLIMVIIIYFTAYPYLRKSTMYKMVPVILLLVVFFSFWSYVKGGYRDFLNQGSARQVKVVSNVDALKYMYGKLAEVDISVLKDGATIFLSRLQYMERYSEVYKRVPATIEHKDGEDLSQTLTFLFVPRFINENKGVKDASQRTSYYTGKRFTTASQGTSISMGYFCDLYIDFGLYFMIIPLVLITVIIGFIYQKILSVRKYNLLFTYTLLVGTFLTFGTFESDSIFFLGALRNSIAFLVLGYYIFFPALHRLVINR